MFDSAQVPSLQFPIGPQQPQLQVDGAPKRLEDVRVSNALTRGKGYSNGGWRRAGTRRAVLGPGGLTLTPSSPCSPARFVD